MISHQVLGAVETKFLKNGHQFTVDMAAMKIVLFVIFLTGPLVSTLPAEPNKKEISDTFNPIRDVAFLIFTRENPTVGEEVSINDMSTVTNSSYDSSRSTKIIIHGAFGDRYNPTNLILCPALLQAGDFSMSLI